MILINSSPKNALKIFQPFLPVFVPVGVGALLAVAEREGIPADYVDEQIEERMLERIAELVKKRDKPYFFGFSVLTASVQSAIDLSKKLREIYPGSFIVFGGIHPSALPEEMLSFGHIDAVLTGECETTLMELYRRVMAGKDWREVENCWYLDAGKITHSKLKVILEDVDKAPAFPYHRFTHPRYDIGFVVSSRGCPYRCSFCSNRVTTGRTYRFRSSELIAEDLEMLQKKYGCSYVIFLDDNFMVNKDRLYKLIDGIRRRGLEKKMVFSFQARGDNTEEGLMRDLFDADSRAFSSAWSRRPRRSWTRSTRTRPSARSTPQSACRRKSGSTSARPTSTDSPAIRTRSGWTAWICP